MNWTIVKKKIRKRMSFLWNLSNGFNFKNGKNLTIKIKSHQEFILNIAGVDTYVSEISEDLSG